MVTLPGFALFIRKTASCMFNQSIRNLFVIIIFVTLIFGCVEEGYLPPDVIPENCWMEEEPRGIAQFHGSTHRFCFEPDQLLVLTVDLWGDVIIPGGCNPIRMVYGVGLYEFRGDTLLAAGDFYEENLKEKKTDCEEGPSFSFKYPVKHVSDAEMILFPEAPEWEQIRLLKE